MEHLQEDHPMGFQIRCRERQFQVGRIMNAALPKDYADILTDADSEVRILSRRCHRTERAIFEVANSWQDYIAKVNYMIADTIITAQNTQPQPVGLVPPEHAGYWLGQNLAQIMQMCLRKDLPAEHTSSMLTVCCGLMDVPVPVEAAENQRAAWHDDIHPTVRRAAVHQLLLHSFPKPYADGKTAASKELVLFGHSVEEQLFQRSGSVDHYHQSVEDVRRQIVELRLVEDAAIKQDINLREQFFLNKMLEFLRHRGYQLF